MQKNQYIKITRISKDEFRCPPYAYTAIMKYLYSGVTPSPSRGIRWFPGAYPPNPPVDRLPALGVVAICPAVPRPSGWKSTPMLVSSLIVL